MPSSSEARFRALRVGLHELCLCDLSRRTVLLPTALSRPLTAAVWGGRGCRLRRSGTGILGVVLLLGSGLPEGAVRLPVARPGPVACAPRGPPVREGSHCGGVSSEPR